MSWYQMILGGGSSPEPGPTPPGPEPPTPTVEIVPFSTGTDEQIAAMLEAYYNDDITWEDMNWSIGETRIIHLPSFALPSPGEGVTDAQDIVVTIVDHDHTDLATPINGHTKACITVQTRELLSRIAGRGLLVYLDGDSDHATVFTKWSDLYIRSYLNETFYNNVKLNNIISLAKLSKHYRHTNYNTSESEIVTDTIFLPSYPEIFGLTVSNNYIPTNPVEGTQFKYFEDISANKMKSINNNGQSVGEAQSWWIGSPSSYTYSERYYWELVDFSGEDNCNSGFTPACLAPAFCL